MVSGEKYAGNHVFIDPAVDPVCICDKEGRMDQHDVYYSNGDSDGKYCGHLEIPVSKDGRIPSDRFIVYMEKYRNLHHFTDRGVCLDSQGNL